MFNNNYFDYSCINMNGLIRNITNHSQKYNKSRNLMRTKVLVKQNKKGLLGFKISITKRVMQKRKLSGVTFSHGYGCLAMVCMQLYFKPLL